MPQGYKNSPAVWQRVIEWVLREVRDAADPYINDINDIVGTAATQGMSEEDLVLKHYLDVRRILDKLAEHKLVAELKKTTFFCRKVDFCGHRLSRGLREPSPG